MSDGFAVGDRVVIRPDFVLSVDSLERDAIGIVETVHPQQGSDHAFLDVRFAPDRLERLRSDTLDLVPERNVTVGHSNRGLE